MLLEDAAELLVEERIGALPLFDERGRPLALLTRRDLVHVARVTPASDQFAEMR